VKPSSFDYAAAKDMADAVNLLCEGGEEAKAIAGGQSLVPLMNMRLARPTLLVDLNETRGTSEITDTGSTLLIGAMVRHSALAAQCQHPLLAEAARHIAHGTIRNRGTIGGSIAHADPAAELPLVALVTGATIHTTGPVGDRSLGAKDFFRGFLDTSLGEHELITGIEIPAVDRWGFAEFSRRTGDFGLALCAVCEIAGEVRVGVGAVASTPLRSPEAEDLLSAGHYSTEHIERAARCTVAAIEANGDTQPLSDYRRHLTEHLVRTALREMGAR
jgi:carbon-monoxide dehydrogenase medium subunit